MPGARPIVVAIDGPAGAGKSSAAKALAQRLALPFLDTGAIYRAVALVARERGVGWEDAAALASIAHALPIRFVPDAAATQNRVFLADREVSQAIREPDVSQGASKVSAVPAVREALLEVQRRVALERGVVAEGRDLGTVVFPDATCKFFLTASVEVRAERRARDLRAAGAGTSADLEVVKREIEERDRRDSSRAVAPLRRAPDAELIDTSHLSLEEVVERMEHAVRSRAFPLTEGAV